MGIFTRRAAVAEWHENGTGVCEGIADTSNRKTGNSWSVRYIRDDKPGSMITVTFTPAAFDAGDGTEWAIERETEFLVCEDPADPGGTEIWSDYDQEDVNELAIYSQADAEREAREFAENALDRAWTHRWDGEPE